MNVWHFESLSVSQGFLMTSAFCKEGSIHIQNKANENYFRDKLYSYVEIDLELCSRKSKKRQTMRALFKLTHKKMIQLFKIVNS